MLIYNFHKLLPGQGFKIIGKLLSQRLLRTFQMKSAPVRFYEKFRIWALNT